VQNLYETQQFGQDAAPSRGSYGHIPKCMLAMQVPWMAIREVKDYSVDSGSLEPESLSARKRSGQCPQRMSGLIIVDAGSSVRVTRFRSPTSRLHRCLKVSRYATAAWRGPCIEHGKFLNSFSWDESLIKSLLSSQNTLNTEQCTIRVVPCHYDVG
jgi:hypothetical protein